MPTSMDEGKPWAADAVLRIAPESILDVGPGAGRWRDLLAGIGSRWIGLEVFAPYVAQFGLTERYDRVVIGDVRTADWADLGDVDLVILGDVLEHMPRADAERVWGDARAHARWVLLSLPIVAYPQGPEFGNPHETHVETWTDAQARALPGVVDASAGATVGVYLARGVRP